jgi:Kip1 ubiquitination-promoting complex protein 2
VSSSGGRGQLRRRRTATEQLSAPEAPDETVVQQLVEMGFPRDEVVAALAATHNDHEAACAWLLGERGGARGTEQPQQPGVLEQPPGTQGGAENMNILLGDIMSHPAIQQGM